MKSYEKIDLLITLVSIPDWNYEIQVYFVRTFECGHLMTKEDESRQMIPFRELAHRLIDDLKAKEECKNGTI